jgi:voltage-gated potassium channel Kch
VGEESERESDVAAEGHPVIICGFGRFGHAVGRLLRHRGFGCTVLEHDADQVDTLRRFGVTVHYGDAARPDLLKAAGAAEAKILVIAVRETFVAKRIIETARRHFPHLKIFVRAFGRVEAYEILETGEDRIYRDTLDASLEMGVGIMKELNCPESEARRAAGLYRQEDERLLREMARHRHDKDEYANRARAANRAFDELMQADREKRQKKRESKS